MKNKTNPIKLQEQRFQRSHGSNGFTIAGNYFFMSSSEGGRELRCLLEGSSGTPVFLSALIKISNDEYLFSLANRKTWVGVSAESLTWILKETPEVFELKPYSEEVTLNE